jgi:hypothetical protein
MAKLSEAQRKKDKEILVKRYFELARKLGKIPSRRDVVRLFPTSNDYIILRFGTFNELKAASLAAHPELDHLQNSVRITEKDIENYRLDLEKKKVKNHNQQVVTGTNLFEYIKQFVEELKIPQIKPIKPPKANGKLHRALNLTLSDLHFGSDTKAEETGNLNYGTIEEARRFATIINETVNYKPQYRNETKLIVNLLGDIIQGKLHDVQDAAAMGEQYARAIHLLLQGLSHLAETYSQVDIYCNPGNHGRDLNRHKGRATSSKWDCIETVIYYALSKALKNYKNVKFHIPKTPFVFYHVFDHKVFITHGDNVLNPGNPGKSLNIKGLENQMNTINATLPDKDEVKVAIVGHTHVASVSELNSGTTLITNGCLEPISQFCASIGILEGRSSQTLFEMTPEYPVGDIRIIRVTKKNDDDKSLDKIIKPWENFNS